VKHYLLMLPGPVEVRPEVLAHMSKPMVAHLGPDFNAFYFSLLGKLRSLFRTEGKVWVLPGSGSTALNAGIVNLAGHNDEILICCNGFFGEVLVEMAEVHGVPYKTIRIPRGEAIDPEDVRRALKENPKIRAVYIIYSESSTGIANPVKDVGSVVKEFGCLYFVDAVSAVGGMELAMDDWNIDFCAAGSQKCLGAPPGVAICAVGPRALEHLRSRSDIRGWVNNFQLWEKYEADPLEPYPVTLPGNLLFALDEGINWILEEGLEECVKRHSEIARFVRNGFRAMGAQPVAGDDKASSTVTAAFLPDGVNPPDVVEYVKRVHGIEIRGGLGDFGSKIIRMGHMAYVAQYRFVVPTLYAVEDALRHFGVKTERGSFLR